MTGVSLDVVDGAVMLALLKTELQVNFGGLLSLVGLEDVTLFGTNEVLEGQFRIILQGGATEDLGASLSVDLEVFDELELVSGASLEVSLVPPEETTIGGGGDTLSTGLSRYPVDVVDGVGVGLLKDGSERGADITTRALAVSPIEEADATVVGTTRDQVTVLLREGQRAQGRAGLETDFRGVRVVEVPDVGRLGHVGGHLLEAELGVGGTNAKLAGLGVPRDFRH